MADFIKDSSSAVLAGGENRRMPLLKAFIEVQGEPIIKKNVRLLKTLFKEIYVITNRPEIYSFLGAPMLGDVHDTRGPMSGIFSALLNSSRRWVFISACDMPFISLKLIRYMASKRDNYQAVVPLSAGTQAGAFTEPLFAFYEKSLLRSMETEILAGRKGLRDFLNNKRVKYITAKEIMEIDPDGSSFVNLNSPADVNRYLQPEDKLRYKIKLKRRGTCLV